MPHSYCVNYQHITFHISRRFLHAEDISELHSYIAGVLLNRGVRDVKVGGINNHVHILGNFSQLIVADEVRQCMVAASYWLKTRDRAYYHDFKWQVGYYSFSVSYSHVARHKDYIANQYKHHLAVGESEELETLKKRNGFPQTMKHDIG